MTTNQTDGKPQDGHDGAALGSSISTIYDAAANLVRAHDMALRRIAVFVAQVEREAHPMPESAAQEAMQRWEQEAQRIAQQTAQGIADALRQVRPYIIHGHEVRAIGAARAAYAAPGGKVDPVRPHGREYTCWLVGVFHEAEMLEEALALWADLAEVSRTSIVDDLRKLHEIATSLGQEGALAQLEIERAIVERHERHEEAVPEPGDVDQGDAPLPEQASGIEDVGEYLAVADLARRYAAKRGCSPDSGRKAVHRAITSGTLAKSDQGIETQAAQAWLDDVQPANKSAAVSEQEEDVPTYLD